jgi:hypothetical protein
MRRAVRDILEELRSWLPNFDHGEGSFPELVFRILASLPGGDALEDAGHEPFDQIGWHEADLMARTIDAVTDKRDVEDLVAGLLAEDDDE